MLQGIGIVLAAVGVALLWGAVTGQSVAGEFLAAVGVGGDETPGPGEDLGAVIDQARGPSPSFADDPAPAPLPGGHIFPR